MTGLVENTNICTNRENTKYLCTYYLPVREIEKRENSINGWMQCDGVSQYKRGDIVGRMAIGVGWQGGACGVTKPGSRYSVSSSRWRAFCCG